MKKLIGHVGVDAGLIWLGDPCYIMGDDATDRVKDWSEFCDILWDADSRHDQDGYSTPLGEHVGLAIQTRWGDGTYPVFGELDSNGRITSVTIDFDPGDEEER